MTFSRFRLLFSLVAATSLSACVGQSAVPLAQSSIPNPRAAGALSPDATPPACKGQKTTKDYASSKPQGLSAKGGSACVPKFKGWGGSLHYPSYTGNGIQMTVISSTTAYDPGAFPPSTSAIFYLQLKFNADVKFGTKMPAGLSLSASGFKLGKHYTIEAARDMGSLWQVLPYCYTTAKPGKYGPMIGGLGYALRGGDFTSSNDAVLMLYEGKLVSTKC